MKVGFGDNFMYSQFEPVTIEILQRLKMLLIDCVLDAEEPYIGDVRVSGFSGTNLAGVVEFYTGISSKWSTICSQHWDSKDANVTCVQLGYESGTAITLATNDL